MFLVQLEIPKAWRMSQLGELTVPVKCYILILRSMKKPQN